MTSATPAPNAAALPPAFQDAIAAALARPAAGRSVEDVEADLFAESARRAVERDAAEPGIAVRLLANLESVERARVARAFAVEAAAEPLEERVAMLASAGAESLLSQLSPVELSAALRALRDLDVATVRALAGFAAAAEAGKRMAPMMRYEPRERSAQGVAGRQYLAASEAGPALVGAWLVAIDPNFDLRPLPAFITPRGECVLALARSWAQGAT